MADDSGQKNGADLPPKIDLRKQGILKNGKGPSGEAPAQPAQPPPKQETSDESTEPVRPDASSTQTTVRIKIPDMPTEEDEAPRQAPGKPPAAATGKDDAAPAASDKPARPAIKISSPGGSAGAQAKTIRIGKTPQQPAGDDTSTPLKPRTVSVPKPAETPAEQDPKRKTSRVPLEKATAIPQGQQSGTPKTIRIKPKAVPGKTTDLSALNRIGKGEAAQPAGGDETAGAKPESKLDSKRKTSRISLESAFTGEETESAKEPGQAPAPAETKPAGAPKTIRLKKPSEAGTIKVKKDADKEEAEGGEDTKAALGKTARLDDLPDLEEEEGATPTRRKTIRVKRPTAKPTVEPGAGAPPAAAVARAQPAEDTQADQVHWVFPVFTALSVLVLLTVIYMFSAQTFGPLVCGTQTSYGLNELNLAWPGKISR